MQIRLWAAIAFLLVVQSSWVQPQERIVLGAALTPAYFEFRKQQYIESLLLFRNWGYGPENVYVVEALKKQGPTFLDDYCKNVFYSTANNPFFRNNGINEALTLLQGVRHFNFDPDDIVIKMTGRYYMIEDTLIKLVKNNPGVDAFVKVNENGDVFTLGFAMRAKYFIEMYANMDYWRMEREWINVEHEVGNYIKRKRAEGNFNVIYVDRLGIRGNLLGSSTAPGIPEEIREW